MRILNRLTRLFIAVAALVPGTSPVVAQEYPAKPIRLIVVNNAGSPQDIVARILSPELSKSLGQPIIVENKVGAGQLVGIEYLARQVPNDGYTIGLLSPTVLAIAPVTVKDLKFDPLRDLPPFIGLAGLRMSLVSPAQAPWKNFNEMVAYARANPGKLNYGSTSPPTRLATEAVLRARGMDIVHVPYKATGPVLQGLAANEVQLNITTLAIGMSLGDKLRVLAVTGDQRHPSLGEVPTFGELGIPVRGATYSMNVPAGTPKSIIDRLYAATMRTLQNPDIRAQFAKQQLDISGDAPDVAARGLLEEARIFAEIGKQIGLQPE